MNGDHNDKARGSVISEWKAAELVRGRLPTVVSRDREQDDIRSEKPGGETRCIEIKGRAPSGVLFVTSPQVHKIRRLGEPARVSVITVCKRSPPGPQYPGPHLSLNMARRTGRSRACLEKTTGLERENP